MPLVDVERAARPARQPAGTVDRFGEDLRDVFAAGRVERHDPPVVVVGDVDVAAE
jgi:hypothetical protein